MSPIRLTQATALILQALATGRRHGFQIMEVSGLPSGTVYPVLRRLERELAVESQWGRRRSHATPGAGFVGCTTSPSLASSWPKGRDSVWWTLNGCWRGPSSVTRSPPGRADDDDDRHQPVAAGREPHGSG